MKTIIVILYILNLEGGSPVAITQFPTMSECLDAMEGTQVGIGAHRDSFARLVCVPVKQ